MKDIPLYKIIRKENLPPIDVMSEAHFAGAEMVSFADTVSGEAPSQKTGAALIYDSNSLYALYVCEETLPLAVYRKHDEPLYEENVVELFIDTLGTGKVYYELEVNPLNARFDAIIINDFGTNGARRGKRFQGFTDWNPSSFESRSFVEDKKWRVILKIDFADLFIANPAPPSKGDKWRGNMLRIDYDGKTQQFHAWSPNYVSDFHCSERFGVWQFE
jgi:hypothetical protein